MCDLCDDLSDLERSTSGSLRFLRFIFRKGAELGHMLLLESIMGSPFVRLHLTLVTLKDQRQGESSDTITFDLGCP